MNRSSLILPVTKLNELREMAHGLPQAPGVYHFMGEKGYPVYIGKSINLRQRVLSHLYAAHTDVKENKIAAATQRISVETTAGELGALILESIQIKQYLPLYNRRLRRQKKLFTWTLDKDNRYHRINICEAIWPPQQNETYFGLYPSVPKAKNKLIQLATKHKLCKKRLGLESSRGTCFGYQLKQCLGACNGGESSDTYNARLAKAIATHSVNPWPFSGPVGIVEGDSEHAYIFDQWNYFGTVAVNALDRHAFNFERPDCALDRDTYHILASTLAKRGECISIVPLSTP